MPDVYEVRPGEDAEDELWLHGLYIEDALDVVDENAFKVFPDHGHPDRMKIIGKDRRGRLLTFIASRPDHDGIVFIITGWAADDEETALYSRPGGTRHG